MSATYTAKKRSINSAQKYKNQYHCLCSVRYFFCGIQPQKKSLSTHKQPTHRPRCRLRRFIYLKEKSKKQFFNNGVIL